MLINDTEQKYALMVDEIMGRQQVVIKSLESGLGRVEGVSGGAILADGRVGLILDHVRLRKFAETARQLNAV
jgi:two-component system chemotaxis sensor kinase CheA